MALDTQHNGSGSHADLFCSEDVFGCGREGNDWPCTPNDLAYFCRRKEQRSLDVSQPSCSVHTWCQLGDLDYWNNSPSNQIPVIRQLEGDNRFELQDVAVFLIDPCVRVEVIFERH